MTLEFQHQIQIPDSDDEVLMELAMHKSWSKFVDYFGNASHVKAVTYSQSPQIMKDLFYHEDISIDSLEVVIGDRGATEYREKLQDADLLRRLNKLSDDGDLDLFTLDSRSILHSKVYIIENRDGTYWLVLGSANLSRQAWRGTKQTNTVIAFKTDGESILDDEFERLYDAHREYCEPWLADLQELLTEVDSPEERAEVYDLWVRNGLNSGTPMAELKRRIRDQFDAEARTINVIDDAEEADEVIAVADGGDTDATETTPDKQIRLSAGGLEDVVGGQRQNMTKHNVVVNNDEIRGSPAGLARYMESVNDFPTMWVDEDDETVYLQVDNAKLEMTAAPENPEQVDEALAHIEEYINTIKRFGDVTSQRSEAPKAHFYEAIIYFFWAPFASYFAREYARHAGAELDKDLPFLYIFGDNDSGKGMLIRFVSRLISNGYVTDVEKGSEFKQDTVRKCLNDGTAFPFIVDDIDKDKVERDILKTYWQLWDGSTSCPSFIFVSNHNKPKSEYRTRMKILDFQVVFNPDGDERTEAAEIAQQDNPLFAYFSHFMFQQDISLPDQGDKLAPARAVFRELYKYANREMPDFFPKDMPAETKYDRGRAMWRNAFRNGRFDVKELNGVVQADFSKHLDGTEVYQYLYVVPSHIRANKGGATIEFPQPERFYRWLGIRRRDGLAKRLRGEFTLR
jgi:hypothetical protein